MGGSKITGGMAIGAVVGGTIGWLLGGPYGAYLGATIGMGIGSYIDPVKLKDQTATPIPQELSVPTADENLPIPDVIGVGKISGNIIWFQEEGSKVVDGQLNYYMSFAIGICEGPVDSLLTVYRNDDMVWTGNLNIPTSGGESTITVGDTEQVPITNSHTNTYSWPREKWSYGYDQWDRQDQSRVRVDYFDVDRFDSDNKSISSITVTCGAEERTVLDWSSQIETKAQVGYTEFELSSALNGSPDTQTLSVEITYVSRTYEEYGGPYMGSMTFYFGTTDQVANEVMASKLDDETLNPAYRGLCYAYFDNVNVGTANRVPNIRFVIQKHPSRTWASEGLSLRTFNYNIAAAIDYMLVDKARLPVAQVDETGTFASVLSTLHSDTLGVSFVMTDQTVLSFIERLLEHMRGGLIYKAQSDGTAKFHLVLYRGDTAASTLPIVNENMMLEPPEIKKPSWLTTFNENRTSFAELIGTPGLVWVIVGSDSRIAFSYEGTVWYGAAYSVSSFTANDVCYMPDFHVYVTACNTLSSATLIMHSFNGTNWFQSTVTGPAKNMLCIGGGNDAGTGIAGGEDGVMFLTVNGVDWNEVSNSITGDIRSVAYSQADEHYILVTSDKKVYKSDDFGYTWTEKATLAEVPNRVRLLNGYWFVVCENDTLYYWESWRNNPVIGFMTKVNPGLGLVSADPESQNIWDISYGSSTYVIVGGYGAWSSSTDLVSWTQKSVYDQYFPTKDLNYYSQPRYFPAKRVADAFKGAYYSSEDSLMVFVGRSRHDELYSRDVSFEKGGTDSGDWIGGEIQYSTNADTIVHCEPPKTHQIRITETVADTSRLLWDGDACSSSGNTGASSDTYRMIFNLSNFINDSGYEASCETRSASKIKVRAGGTGSGVEIQEMWIGLRINGTYYHFDGRQVEVTWGGTSGVTLASGTSWSDEIEINLDWGQAYGDYALLVSFNVLGEYPISPNADDNNGAILIYESAWNDGSGDALDAVSVNQDPDSWGSVWPFWTVVSDTSRSMAFSQIAIMEYNTHTWYNAICRGFSL